MKPTLISQQSLAEQDVTISVEDMECIFFRLIGVGPNTISESKFSLRKIADKVDKMPGWAIITDKGDARKTLHDLVDRFCDERESMK